MKRSGPLRRLTPLRSSKPLNRVSAKGRKRNAELAKSRRIVMERANGLCEVIGCGLQAQHVHHRKLRSQGRDDTPPNLMALCVEHHGRAHGDRDWATVQGLILTRKQRAEEDPERFDQ